MSQKFEQDMMVLVQRLSNFVTKPTSTDSSLVGFVDSYGNLYPITLDTKVLSKVIEFIFSPIIKNFCAEYGYTLEEPRHQNYYPDLTFIDNKSNKKYAVDIKTTYRITEKEFTFNQKKYLLKLSKSSYTVSPINNNWNDYSDLSDFPSEDKISEVIKKIKSENKVNGMTLGAYTGYFKERTSNKNILYPYSEYSGHYILGFLYSREDELHNTIKNISTYREIESPIYDIKIFFIEKFKIATTSPGSGNTKNIGSVKTENKLLSGDGDFKTLQDFDSFWLNYKNLK